MNYSVLLLVLAAGAFIAMLSVVSRRAGVPTAIVMFVVGIIMTQVPGMPELALKPDFVLLVLLPPLLYSSGVYMSWRGFRANLRPILLLAVGCVLFTAAAVAAVVHYLLGFSWSVGFVLGSIVSPPDAVAPMAIARQLHLPRRVGTILEGESLVNDATALVSFGFAVNAVATGDFSLTSALSEFTVVCLGELAYGSCLGWLMLRIRHAMNEPRAEVLLALAMPFMAFWLPHAAGGSGVIACVTCGLWVSWNGRRYIRPATRLQGFFIWDLITWVIEALIFLLTGLQAPEFIDDLSRAEWLEFIKAGGIVSITVIVVRFIWVFPATYMPRWLSKSLRQRDPYPNWRVPTLVGYAGLRGAVSLAAALSVPNSMGGLPFPERELILFITFFVIVVTLVGLGVGLPSMIRLLGLDRIGHAEAVKNLRAERSVRMHGIETVLQALDGPLAGKANRDTIEAYRRWLSDRLWHLSAKPGPQNDHTDPLADAIALQLNMVAVERIAVLEAYLDNQITDEARRRIERELDLEEARLQHFLAGAGSAHAHDTA